MQKYITNEIIKSKSQIIEIYKKLFADSFINVLEDDFLTVLDSNENVHAFFCTFTHTAGGNLDINSFNPSLDKVLPDSIKSFVIGVIADNNLKMKTVRNLIDLFSDLRKGDDDFYFMVKNQEMINNETVVFVVAIE